MEMRNLIEGQAAFGATTGVAYQSLTHDIQAATGGMIQFKEAAQAAAIGTAAGLSAGQLEQIGVAAKNTSLALGRDLTDSFNRLTRGITKAEPELLDELGIVLRLEPAMKAYATSIQKNVSDLTQFEKSQAVANEVLEQAETKFGSITKIMDPSAFALQRFAVAFDELVIKIQKGTANFMIPIMEFASKNVYALVGALTLFLAPILKSILPDFAIEPFLSKLYLEFFLTHSSIMQLPGPESKASRFSSIFSSIFIILVIFEIPPILRKQIGSSIKYFSLKIFDNKL